MVLVVAAEPVERVAGATRVMSVTNERARQSSYILPGLSAPAEILVDAWGIPHIYAENAYDAFRVQGFNAARIGCGR